MRPDIKPSAMPRDPFALDDMAARLRPLIEWALALPQYRRLYQQVRTDRDGGTAPDRWSFEDRVLNALNIAIHITPGDLERVPVRGPLVVAANHPHGILDGLLLMSILRPIRPDVRVLTNHLLARIPELHEFSFFVDPFGGPAATARSHGGLRAAYLWLRRGGALVVFPAGEVAHRPMVEGRHAESRWKATAMRLAEASGAQVIAAHITGTNSRLFYAAGRLHPAMRTVLLTREFLKKRGAVIPVRLGAPGTAAVKKFGPAAIAEEIQRLPPGARLVESGAFQVFCADAARIFETLREIGRLREIAYRAVGEGTGRNVDLDAFDERYRHLFLWDRERGLVVGAYRLGLTDRIVAQHGVDGLYTRTLFRYGRELLDRLGGPALELGRSFVRIEYQKHHSALLMLWKGIGRFVATHPQYRYLFGPVSISARYSDTSHALLIEFLRQNHLDRELSAVVDAINPPRMMPAPDARTLVPRSVDEVNRLVERAEGDGKGVPVLLRQYLKLNARLIGFNTDPAFGDALDALMIVDLAAIGPAILARYLGRAEAAAFVAFHRDQRTQAA
jgi:putative hemolysin